MESKRLSLPETALDALEGQFGRNIGDKTKGTSYYRSEEVESPFSSISYSTTSEGGEYRMSKGQGELLLQTQEVELDGMMPDAIVRVMNVLQEIREEFEECKYKVAPPYDAVPYKLTMSRFVEHADLPVELSRIIEASATYGDRFSEALGEEDVRDEE